MAITTLQISTFDEVIDSRDVIALIEELRDMETDGDLDDTGKEQLAALEALAEQAEGYADDWRYGEALIRDDYFEEYAENLAIDIGAIDANATWPNNCIDWEAAADALKQDYTAVEFDGVTYWIR